MKFCTLCCREFNEIDWRDFNPAADLADSVLQCIEKMI